MEDPGDLAEQGRAHDLKRLGGATVEIRCHLPIEQQARSMGATWLDQQLTKGSTQWPNSEFGANIRQALKDREDFLVDQGLARRSAAQVITRAEPARYIAGPGDSRGGSPHRVNFPSLASANDRWR